MFTSVQRSVLIFFGRMCYNVVAPSLKHTIKTPLTQNKKKKQLKDKKNRTSNNQIPKFPLTKTQEWCLIRNIYKHEEKRNFK